MFKENYLVDNWTSDYWKVSIYLVFFETLEHLVEERPKRVKESGALITFMGIPVRKWSTDYMYGYSSKEVEH
jgi:hypothetical protein